MRCKLYVKTRINNGEHYVEVANKTLKTLVGKIEEKKSTGILSMPLDYYADIEEGINSYVFFRACNVLEYLRGFFKA